MPLKLNDGTHDYILVHQAKVVSINPPISELALYERVPKDDKYQYTPDLQFVLGQTSAPLMYPVERSEAKEEKQK